LLTGWTLELTNKGGNRVPSPSRDYTSPDSIFPPPEGHRRPSAGTLTQREPKTVALPNAGGLILVGSYVPTTTRQLARLAGDESLLRVKLCVDRLLSARRRELLGSVAAIVTKALATGQDVVVFTSRPFVGGDNPARSLQIGGRISEALVELVCGLEIRPRYIVAKGGITASDLATRALNVKRAMVLGQLVPGVPVWRLGVEAKFPGLVYVVFPGNVGGPDALAYAIEALNCETQR
jgi:uncharacterized protein YgbK (DUF1537 family)